MATVLVTGGAGYIGSFTRRALREAGHRPVSYDNLSTGHHEFVRGEDLVVGDLSEGAKLRAVIADHQVEAVIHFAASALARESVVKPAEFYENNVVGMMHLLEACRANGVSVLVFSSSCATYGHPQYIPMDERHPQSPISPYGRSKLIGEWMLRDYERAYQFRYAALRYFNVAGGDPDGAIGEWHEPETHLIPLALTAAATGRAMSIFGADLDTPDGTCIRDYIHVIDLARAHVLALDHLLGGGRSLEVNLGTGIGHSIRQVLAAVERIVGRPVPTVVTPPQPGDPPQLVADPSLARELLGFRCDWIDLDRTIASAWAFHRMLLEKSRSQESGVRSQNKSPE
jgi:UDP-arabinose 4-epimerase